MATSLLLGSSEDDSGSRTPITSSAVPSRVTVSPTALRPSNSSVAVSGPRTTTAATCSSSSAVRKRPLVTSRDRTVFQASVVPVSVVVQLVSPTISEAVEVAVPATATTSGAASSPASASTSAVVSVDAEPKPPRAPVLSVELPGEITSTLVPSSSIWSRTSALAPWPSPTVSTTAPMPMRMPSMVSAERSRWVRTASMLVPKVSRQVTGVLRRGRRSR